MTPREILDQSIADAEPEAAFLQGVELMVHRFVKPVILEREVGSEGACVIQQLRRGTTSRACPIFAVKPGVAG